MPPEAAGTKLTGAQRAAILLMAMGEREAAEVLRYMSPKEVQSLGIAMTDIGRVTQEQLGEVLDTFADEVKNESSLGLGSEEFLKSVLPRALGLDVAELALPKIMLGKGQAKGIETLKWMAPRDIADIIGNEHPQVIALALLHLDEETAGKVLSLLAEETQRDVVMRVAGLEGVHPSAIKELDEVLERELSGKADLTFAEMGGTKAVAGLLTNVPRKVEKSIREYLNEVDPALNEQLENLLFNFESFVDLDDRSMQMLLREIQSETLVVALKGASQNMHAKIFKNMSARASDLLRDDLDARGPVRLHEVEQAQREILDVARKLADDGQLLLPGQDDDFV